MTKIKACPGCHGTGLRQNVTKQEPCRVCSGTGVPVWDEKFNDALDFLEVNNHDYVDLDSDEDDD